MAKTAKRRERFRADHDNYDDGHVMVRNGLLLDSKPMWAYYVHWVGMSMLFATLLASSMAAVTQADGAGGMPSPFHQVDARDRAIGSRTPLDGGDGDHMTPLPPSYPTKEFSAQDSSPVLVIGNLSDYESVMHITADVVIQDPKTGAKSYSKIPVFDLGVPSMTGLKLPPGVHAFGVPDFHANHTAALEFKFWTPCDWDPLDIFDLTLMPCFYTPFEAEEGKTQYPYFSHGQRGTMYMPYHIPEDLRHESYAKYLEAQEARRAAGNCTEDGDCTLSGDDDDEAPIVRINTKVDCWFPPHRNLETLATPIHLFEHDTRVAIRDLVYQRVPVTTPPSGETELYYDTRIKQFPAKPLDPIPEEVKEAANGAVPEIVDGAVIINDKRYCRSTLQVFASDPSDDSKLATEAVGWTLVSGTQKRQ